MNEKLETLFSKYKDTKFKSRVVEGAERKAIRREVRYLSSKMTDEFMNVTDADYAKDFNNRKSEFDVKFTFYPEAKCESEFSDFVMAAGF